MRATHTLYLCVSPYERESESVDMKTSVRVLFVSLGLTFWGGLLQREACSIPLALTL